MAEITRKEKDLLIAILLKSSLEAGRESRGPGGKEVREAWAARERQLDTIMKKITDTRPGEKLKFE